MAILDGSERQLWWNWGKPIQVINMSSEDIYMTLYTLKTFKMTRLIEDTEPDPLHTLWIERFENELIRRGEPIQLGEKNV